MAMKIPVIPSPVAQRWKQRGISLADGPTRVRWRYSLAQITPTAYAKEVVWCTTFGWMLSGDSSRQPETSVQVA